VNRDELARAICNELGEPDSWEALGLEQRAAYQRAADAVLRQLRAEMCWCCGTRTVQCGELCESCSDRCAGATIAARDAIHLMTREA
jgi:hypothetical protein